ncbi:MAG: DHH family phosphoesterase [Planctomycetes bacterium]|jgi:nanoRNase/pAp phosphatase (c-di-AMP/oligoRNAs hydrolase)|nr:DHH family phosphoesterase [Planctomycetota bacterium]
MSSESAGTSGQGRTATLSRRSDRFLAGLEEYRGATLVSHVHPDPDSLGSMVGLAYLIEQCVGIPVQITQDGPICRAENRAMVETLDLSLTPIEKVKWKPDQAVVMVDSQPKTGRHSFNGEAKIYGVIDHHQTPGELDGVPFLDIRDGIGATCSLITRYFTEQEIGIPEHVATCLYYGIETELSGYPREASALDDTALQLLYPIVDRDAIAKIKNAPLPEVFYETLLQALQSSFIYDKLLLSWINELANPELCSQCVEFLIRHEGIKWAMCAGIHEDRMVLSVRTSLHRAQAGEILRAVVQKMGGRAGGHDRRAGGFIPLASTSPSAIEQVQSEFRRRMLKCLAIEETRGRRLVSRGEMLRNLG